MDRPRRDLSTVFVIAVFVVTSGFVVGTTASFNATTRNQSNAFATAALSTPTDLNASMEGSSVKLSWASLTGAANQGAGYNVSRKVALSSGVPTATGESPGCTPGGFTKDGDTSVASYTDLDIARPAAGAFSDGQFHCYEVQTVFPCCPAGANPWLSQGTNPVVDVQVGHVISTVQIIGNGNGKPAEDEQIVVNFSQPVDTQHANRPTTSHTVCWSPPDDRINIASTTASGACDATETVRVGRLSGTLPGFFFSKERWSIKAVDWSICPVANGCKKLTITLGPVVNSSINTPGTPTLTMLPSTTANSLMSKIVGSNGAALAICSQTNSGTRFCQPRATGNF